MVAGEFRRHRRPGTDCRRVLVWALDGLMAMHTFTNLSLIRTRTTQIFITGIGTWSDSAGAESSDCRPKNVAAPRGRLIGIAAVAHAQTASLITPALLQAVIASFDDLVNAIAFRISTATECRGYAVIPSSPPLGTWQRARGALNRDMMLSAPLPAHGPAAIAPPPHAYRARRVLRGRRGRDEDLTPAHETSIHPRETGCTGRG